MQTQNRINNTISKHLLIISFNTLGSSLKFKLIFKKMMFLLFKVKTRSVTKRKQIISILTSPHVNKIAQEQFHKAKILQVFEFTNISNYPLFLLVLKKLKLNGFADITIKHLIIYENNKRRRASSFHQNMLEKNRNLLHTRTPVKPSNYLKLLDLTGELFLISGKHL